ncbi:NADPH-dependent FMN reductase [Cellulomonas flavigena DSM 20109]|uniref:NADPH-dependent FMN reductase n=1 Tax=Cellulomonas flavigena (strain ATCC 482 / DSM 20109 / BCRC 11376 / JCM 18109 / NBRC 3775 / NCIMB 8073 / NRS 134) TaxID=446466 RepID=D5UJS7_CELFN|nr:CE1759 family FMN reductase [Cellulomonas flavigena]ADG75715.1 NADPH-dependent FMN reductase [Cellulomonas flavigena DSM 20109]
MPSRSLVVVSGGLSQPSSTRMLADRLAEATVADLAARGIDTVVEVVELRGLAHDVVDMTLTGYARPDLAAAQSALAGADGVVAVTPVFAASYAGLFKSFVDVLDPEALRDTPVLLGATGGTARHSLALEHAVRPLFAYLHADVVPTSVFAATDDWADAGTDDVKPLPARIARAAAELARRVAAREPVQRGGLYDGVPSFEDLLGG